MEQARLGAPRCRHRSAACGGQGARSRTQRTGKDEARQAAAAARDAWFAVVSRRLDCAGSSGRVARESAVARHVEQTARPCAVAKCVSWRRIADIVQKRHPRAPRPRCEACVTALGLDSAVRRRWKPSRERTGPEAGSRRSGRDRCSAGCSVAEIANLRDERRQVSVTREMPPIPNLAQLEARLAQLDASRADPGRGSGAPRAGARCAGKGAEHARADLDRETPDWRKRVAEADRLAADRDRTWSSRIDRRV